MKNSVIVSTATGFAVSFLTASFVWYGVTFVLYLFDRWQISTINTIILYAMLFILAKVGTQFQHRKQKRKETRTEPSDGVSPNRPRARATLLSALWYGVAIFAIAWLTPSVVIYWASRSPYPPHTILPFAYLFSLTAAALLSLGHDDRFATWKSKLAYTAGACLGPVLLHVISI